jgi:hypothetical protein
VPITTFCIMILTFLIISLQNYNIIAPPIGVIEKIFVSSLKNRL